MVRSASVMPEEAAVALTGKALGRYPSHQTSCIRRLEVRVVSEWRAQSVVEEGDESRQERSLNSRVLALRDLHGKTDGEK